MVEQREKILSSHTFETQETQRDANKTKQNQDAELLVFRISTSLTTGKMFALIPVRWKYANEGSLIYSWTIPVQCLWHLSDIWIGDNLCGIEESVSDWLHSPDSKGWRKWIPRFITRLRLNRAQKWLKNLLEISCCDLSALWFTLPVSANDKKSLCQEGNRSKWRKVFSPDGQILYLWVFQMDVVRSKLSPWWLAARGHRYWSALGDTALGLKAWPVVRKSSFYTRCLWEEHERMWTVIGPQTA